jgi:hypothetical protein
MVEGVYVGSLGRRLISTAETNFPVPSVEQQQIINTGGVNEDCARPLANCYEPGPPPTPVSGPFADANAYPTGVTQIYTNFSNGLSDSDEFQLTVDKRLSQMFAVRGAYTLGKTIDLTSGFRSRSSTYTDPLDPRLDRAVADFDVHQRLVISGIWELGLDRRLESGVLKKIAQGWQFNGIATFQGGQPITLYSGYDSSLQNNGLSRPDIVGPIQYYNPRNTESFTPNTADCLGASSSGNYWFNPNSFDCVNVPLFSFGSLPRNSLRGPGINNFDLSLIKKTALAEKKSLEFRAEFFNAFNHVQFLNPDNQGGSSTFGQISTDRGMRIIQFGLKFYY